MKKNVASQVVGAQLIAKADGTPVTAGTTTVYVTGDGGTQATGSVGSGACTHEGNGFWTYAPAQAETNYDHVAFTFVNTSAINATVQVYPSFPPTPAEIADGILARSLAGGADGGRTVQDALRSLRNKSSISGGTLTVCEEDDTTTAWTAAVTTTPGDPLSAIDPA